MLKKVTTATLLGIEAEVISVETDIQNGLPAVNMVGLPNTTIKEARERIRAAIINSGYAFPKRRVTVNLSPANVPKDGSHFDLPIAIGILGLMDERISTDGLGFIGELSLDGSLKAVPGALPLAMKMREKGVRGIVLPAGNAAEVSLLNDVRLFPVKNLAESIDFISGIKKIEPYSGTYCVKADCGHVPDFAEVYGQEAAKRALVIAAAGSHGIMMTGSPGSGKTMLAKRMPYIMPEMTYDEVLDVVRIYSAAGLAGETLLNMGCRPFRMPHHTISKAALSGGGRLPGPGEISLAHNGILFLDEFGEFAPSVIELIREPLEEGKIRIHREKMSVELPCRFLLVAASNPCRCGFDGDERRLCTCTQYQKEQYRAKFSGPMMDRIDLHIRINPPDSVHKIYEKTGLSTGEMKEMVSKAVMFQRKRYGDDSGFRNGWLTDDQIKEFCRTDKPAGEFIKQAYEKLGLSLRSYSKILKVSRTIADLEAEPVILIRHVAEALQYRDNKLGLG